MNESNTQTVVVTDIRMPFWSMVVFMIKWAVAAIPAMFILAAVVAIGSVIATNLISYAHRSTAQLESTKQAQQSVEPIQELIVKHSSSKPTDTFVGVPDRCKGNPEQERCIAEERRLAAETTDQKTRRQQALEAERTANLAKVR